MSHSLLICGGLVTYKWIVHLFIKPVLLSGSERWGQVRGRKNKSRGIRKRIELGAEVKDFERLSDDLLGMFD